MKKLLEKKRIGLLTTLIVVVGLVALGYAHLAMALDKTGLILYLPFDEESGKIAKDGSGNNNDGELLGDAEWVNGKYGKAVSISDNDLQNQVLIEDSKSLGITDQITMAAWVNIQGFKDSWNAIIVKDGAYMLHVDVETDPAQKNARLDPLIFIGGTYGTWPSTAASPVPLGDWHHVAGIYDGKEIKTYVDGEMTGSVARSGQIDITDADILIGRDNRAGCEARIFSLMVDEVVILDYAISDTEVNELMDGYFTPVTPRGHATILWGQIKSQYTGTPRL